MKIGILGSGTWGVALANALIAKHEVSVWTPFKKEFDLLSTRYIHPNLKDVVISSKINFSLSIEEVIKNKDIIIFAVPSIYVRETALKAKPYLKKEQIIVDVAKGIEEDSLFTLSEVIHSVLGDDYNVVALSGPTHAEEVAIKLPTLIVSSCPNLKIAKIVQKEFSLPYFRVYVNTDIKGVELSGSLKNIIALASGISDGLGYGDNAKAAIVTRGLAEIVRLAHKLGCSDSSFFGLTGIGDIVVTSTSKHSRNYNAGYYLGKGFSLSETLEKVGMVVEGINCLKAAKKLALSQSVDMPIVDAVYSIIFEGVKPLEAVNSLFSRDLKCE